MSNENLTAQGQPWNYRHLLCALIIGFLLQSLFLPCLCQIGTAKIAFAYVFDGLVILRTIAAKLMKERNRGWIFYAGLVYASPLWIEVVSRILLGAH